MSATDPPFTLDQLCIVRAIAQHGSFRRAADSLYISQPAVSLQIQNLERQLGIMLFDRGGRQVQLTEAGHILLEYSDRILTLCQEAKRALMDLQDLKRGTLTLGASQTVGTYVMPLLMGQFWKAYPHISVQLFVQSTRRIAQRVINGELDLAIVGGEVPLELRRSLEVLPFAQDEFVLVTSAAQEHGVWSSPPSRTQPPLEKSDLGQLQFITLDAQSSTRQTLDRSLNQCGIDPSSFPVQMELSSIEAIKTAVKAGLGVAFLSLTAVGAELERRTLRRLEVAGLHVKRTLWLISNPDRYQSRAAKLFRQGVLERSDWWKAPMAHLELDQCAVREQIEAKAAR